MDPVLSIRDYTFLYQWKRSLTDVDMKRRKAAEKERERLKIDVIENIANPSLKFEIEHFKLFGSLRKSETEVHNTIPNTTTVCAEKDYIEFEHHRKRQPHDVGYNNFYGCIKDEANKPRTPQSRPLTVDLPSSSRSVATNISSPSKSRASNLSSPKYKFGATDPPS